MFSMSLLEDKLTEEEFLQLSKICVDNQLSFKQMINPERKLNYIVKKYDLANADYVLMMIRLFIHMGKVEKKIGKDFCEFTFKDFIKFFETFNWSRTSFSSNKSQIMQYLDWCNNHNLCDIEVLRDLEKVSTEIISNDNLYRTSYFINFEELKDVIKEKIEKDTNAEYEKYDTPKIALYLSWFGISINDICEIKKTDVKKDKNQIFVERTGEYINILPSAMREIIEYRDSEGYVLKKDCKHGSKYVDSYMLMRSKLLEKMKYSALQRQVSNSFNEKDDNAPDSKNVTLIKVYWSGIFSRAYQYEQENNIELGIKNIKVIKKLFKLEDKTDVTVYNTLNLYHDYCSFFFGKHYFK